MTKDPQIENELIQRLIDLKYTYRPEIRYLDTLEKNFMYKYVQGVLNSDVIKFYFNELMYNGKLFYPNHIKAFPIKQLDLKYQEILSIYYQMQSFMKFICTTPSNLQINQSKNIFQTLNLLMRR